MLNALWPAMLAIAVCVGGLTGRMDAVADACAAAAGQAVEVGVGLAGPMVLWLGALEVLRAAGAVTALTRALAPVLGRLFPDVPADHPALGVMGLNLVGNFLGLGNAATPLGVEAMRELARLAPAAGAMTPAMLRFLALNTAGICLVPTSMLALRAAAGSRAPAAIVLPALIASCAAAAVGLLAARLLGGRAVRTPAGPAALTGPATAPATAPAAATTTAADPMGLGARVAGDAPSARRRALAWGAGLAAAVALCAAVAQRAGTGEVGPGAWAAARDGLGRWLVPVLILSTALIGVGGGVRVYDAAARGGRTALGVVAGILPHLVLLLVAVAMLRAAGVIDAVAAVVAPAAAAVGMPGEAVPMALMRPLSGSGALALAAEALRAHGPDSPVGFLVSTLMASHETTLYVIAVYAGAAGVRVGRGALACCLLGELAGAVVATLACRALAAAGS